MEKIIWQPSIINRYNFAVSLDRDFAREMMKAQIPAERQKKMNEIGNKDLKELGINWLNPYTFYANSCFVNQIYIGRNGVWLSTKCNSDNIERLLKKGETKPIEYHSHNVDTSQEAYVLMNLFDKWVNLSDALKNI
jgi:hypothetical protein